MKHNIFPIVARAVLPLLVLSLVSNLAILVSPLFMMQVLDRVIPSGNIATLALLGSLALAALVLQALVEAARDVSLGRLARWSEREGTGLALAPSASKQGETVGHVAGFSSFLSGRAAIAALGAPWIPIFLFVLWSLHPAFLVLLVAMSGMFGVSRMTSKALGYAAQQNALACERLQEATLREVDVATRETGIAMLVRNLRLRFADIQRQRHHHVDQGELPSVSHTTISSLIRNVGQISALGLGALLVTADQLSAGGMIAASIISSKSYAAIEALLVSLPSIRSARQDYLVLASLPSGQSEQEATIETPSGSLSVENLIFPRGGGAPPRLDRISFNLPPGECLAIVGRSGSGKTTLLRALVGTASAPIGSVFLGDNEIKSIPEAALFHMAGFVPQCAVLKTGTIAENISCFELNADPQNIVAAAKTAGVHGLISALPNSYETNVGAEPHVLSMGQMQRVALARAVYGRPKYLFLDEPNALLDAEGERALAQALLRLKNQGTTIVMAVHRSGILGLADKVVHLDHGRITDFGSKSDVLGRLGMDGRQIQLPTLKTSMTDLKDWIASQFTRDGDYDFSQKAQVAASELLGLACENCPPDTLRFADFMFKFVDKTQCEIVMRERVPSDATERIARVDSGSEGEPGQLEQTDRDEMRIERLSGMSETLEIASDDEGTSYRMVLIDEEERLDEEWIFRRYEN